MTNLMPLPIGVRNVAFWKPIPRLRGETAQTRCEQERRKSSEPVRRVYVEPVLVPISKFPAPSHQIGAKWKPRENGRERMETFLCEKHSANCAKTSVLRSILPRGLNSPVLARNLRCCSISKKTTKCETIATGASALLCRKMTLLHASSSRKRNKAVVTGLILAREMTSEMRNEEFVRSSDDDGLSQ